MPTETNSSSPGLMRRLGAAGPVAIVLSFWPPLGGFVLLAALTQLGPWLRLHGEIGILIYFLLCALLIGVSFVPTYSCAILAGWAFGFWTGWPLAMITITVGSIIAYAIGRGIARDRVVQVIRDNPRANSIHRALLSSRSGRILLVVALLRVPPASPFAIANFVLAAARVPLFEYIVGTLVGIGPRTAAATFTAAGLEQLQFKNASETWIVVASITATILVCVILGVLCNRVLRKMADPERGRDP